MLRCGIDIGALARNAESGHIFHSRGVLSVRGPVPASVLREETGDPRRHAVEFPHEPVGLARWINRLLELQPHKSVSRRHPGVQRLAQWIQRRIAQDPDGHISGSEVAQVASRWRWR